MLLEVSHHHTNNDVPILAREIPVFLTKKPGVPEQDFSGTIAGGDLEGSGFKIGDEVYGALPVSFAFSAVLGGSADIITCRPIKDKCQPE